MGLLGSYCANLRTAVLPNVGEPLRQNSIARLASSGHVMLDDASNISIYYKLGPGASILSPVVSCCAKSLGAARARVSMTCG